MDRYQTLLQFSFLSPQDVVNIVWAAEGVKPAGGLQLDEVHEGDIECLIHILNGYGLYTAYRVVNDTHVVKGEELTFTIPLLSFSVTREKVIEDVRLDCPCQRTCQKTLWRKYGGIYGLPETAIRGFIEMDRLEDKTILTSVFTEEEYWFFSLVTPFCLSAKHWRAEAETLREWMRSFRNDAPTTYAHFKTCHWKRTA